MTTTLVLGAGFSCGISPSMPLTSSLAENVFQSDSEDFDRLAFDPSNRGDVLERYLSVLAEPQPYLSLEANLENHARFITTVRQIAHTVQGRWVAVESRILSSA